MRLSFCSVDIKKNLLQFPTKFNLILLMITLQQIQVNPEQGLKQTLFQMYLLEKKAINNVEFVTWVHKNFFFDCVSCLPGRVWNYVQNNFDFVLDEPYDEVIIAPYLMPSIRKGDCDDFSLFIKTCMDILGGWFTNYLLLGKNRNQFTHIIVFAHRGKFGNEYIDPVYIDGANNEFNVIPQKYNYCKII